MRLRLNWDRGLKGEGRDRVKAKLGPRLNYGRGKIIFRVK